MNGRLPQDDLDDVVRHVGGLWGRLDGARVLFTGASGFFGSWMLESFLHAGTQLNLPFRAVALTRNARRFSEYLPHIASDPRVELLEADAATMPTPEGPVDDIIHSLVPDARTPLLEMKDFFPSATQRLLAIAPQKHSRTFLLCSTGAVYHPKDPPAPFAEGDPLTSSQGPITYGQIRRHVEDQCLNTLANSPTALKIARGFSFVGPRLPLDANFAIGNFIRDAQDRGPILVKGDGLPVRSYLYASDMAVWLWTILLKGEQGTAFNVGSEEATTIGDLARAIGAMFDVDVQSGSLPLPGAATASYLPLTTRARGELGLAARTSLRTGIEKMARWHGLPKPTTSI